MNKYFIQAFPFFMSQDELSLKVSFRKFSFTNKQYVFAYYKGK